MQLPCTRVINVFTFKSTYVRCFALSKAQTLTSRHLIVFFKENRNTIQEGMLEEISPSTEVQHLLKIHEIDNYIHPQY